MKTINISRITNIYPYCSARKRWSNLGPRKLYILSYQLTGHYDHDFSFGTLSVKKDCLFFIHPEDSYRAREIERGTSICVSFEGEADVPTQLLDCRDQPAVRVLFQRLLQYRDAEKESEYCAGMAICYEILSLMCKSSERRYTASGVKARLSPAYAYMLEHYREPKLQTKALAAMCGISTRYFSSLFQEVYGAAPTQYLIGLRLRAAQELLASGMHSVGETAELCGFGDVYYFSRLFKKKLGMTPQEYRQQRTKTL